MQIVHHLPSLLQDWTLHTVHTVNTCTQHTTSPLWGCIECIECTLFAHIAHYISKPPSCTFPGFLLKSGKSLVTPVVLLPLYSFTNVGYFEPDKILGNLNFPSPFFRPFKSGPSAPLQRKGGNSSAIAQPTLYIKYLIWNLSKFFSKCDFSQPGKMWCRHGLWMQVWQQMMLSWC